jgi:uncharacterized protein DUF6786
MDTNYEKVIQLLKQGGYEYQTINVGNGAILGLPSYGRVLGLWCDKRSQSVYWMNPQFLKYDDTKKELEWVNPGGHRMWIAPEREFFIRDLSRPFETYKVPVSVDPGQYEIEFECNQLIFKNKGTLRAFNSNKDISFRLTRQIKAMDEQFMEGLVGNLELQAVGYEDEAILETDTNFKIGIWSLTQVFLSSEVFIAADRDSKYNVFFGDENDKVHYADGFWKVRFDKGQDFKIGLKASGISDKIFYIRRDDNGSATLIVKVFEKGSDESYVDTPWDDPEDIGYAVQFFCGGGFGFGEIETHSPVFNNGDKCVSKSRVRIYAFSGQFANCLNLAQRLATCDK